MSDKPQNSPNPVLVTLPEFEFLEFRRQARIVAGLCDSPVHAQEVDRLRRLAKALDAAWLNIQPEYGPGLDSVAGPVIARPSLRRAVPFMLEGEPDPPDLCL